MSSRLLLTHLAIFLALSLASPAIAAIVIVKADGTGAAATIQAGIDAASNGDTILLEPGTYTGVGNRDVDFNGKAVIVTSVSGAALTVIDCQGLGRGFTLTSGENENSVISGVTIMNGTADYGGGIYIAGWGAEVNDNLFADNDAGSWGGGLYALGTTATVSNSVIADNSAGFFGGGAYFRDGSPTMRNVTVVGNTGSGAVVTYTSSLAVEKSIIAFHTTSAMQCFAGGAATVSCSDLFGNQSNAICGVDAGQNISEDPLFCDSGDYALLPMSPCTAGNSPCGEQIGGAEECAVTVSVHDAGGRLVDVLVDEERDAGPHSVVWNGTDRAGKRVSSGVYFVRMTTPQDSQAKKMVLLK